MGTAEFHVLKKLIKKKPNWCLKIQTGQVSLIETTNLMPQSSASINTAEMLICKGIIFYFF